MYTQISDEAMMNQLIMETIRRMPEQKRMDFITNCLCEFGATEFHIKYPLENGGECEVNYSKK
jgi:hypothetical protein